MENAIALKTKIVNAINLFSLLGRLLSLKVEIIFFIMPKSNSLSQFNKLELALKMANGISFIDIIVHFVI